MIISKMKRIRLFGVFIFLSLCVAVVAQQDYDNVEGASSVEVYKTVGDVEMRLWFFSPDNVEEESKRSAIIFYFGGGWNGGTPNQFVKHCEYLKARGMIAIVADYRVKSRHGVKAEICVADAKSSIRYLRKHADRLNIDPDKIVSAGGSAGGHLGASVATLPSLDDPKDDMQISCIPNASVLFNPVLVTAAIPEKFEMKDRFSSAMSNRIAVSLESFSPYHNIKFGVCPMLVFHGTGDETVPFVTAKVFHDKMRSVGNVCTLVAYEDEGHGFFNYGKKTNGPFIDTVKRMDDFLVLHGFIDPAPNFKVY